MKIVILAKRITKHYKKFCGVFIRRLEVDNDEENEMRLV